MLSRKFLTIKSIWLLFFTLTFSGISFSQPVSKFGTEILKDSKYIVGGTPVRRIDLKGGGLLVFLKIEQVFYGLVEQGSQISLLYQNTDLAPMDQKKVVFLKPLRSTTAFEVTGEFSFQEEDSGEKIAALREIIAIENLPDLKSRKALYLKYCRTKIQSEKLWTAAHALAEWEHITKKHSTWISNEANLDEVQKKITRPDIQNKFRRLIKRFQPQNIPTSTDSDWESVFHYKHEKAKKLILSNAPAQRVEALHFFALYQTSELDILLKKLIFDTDERVQLLAAFYAGQLRISQTIPELQELRRSKNSSNA